MNLHELYNVLMNIDECCMLMNINECYHVIINEGYILLMDERMN